MRLDLEFSRYVSHLQQWVFALADIHFSIHTRGFSQYGGILLGYFSSNLESVRKDVECTFGILKKRWRILNYGLHYRDIKKCEKIFVTCCCLHNFLVDIMEWKVKLVKRGGPIDQHDGLWLEGLLRVQL